MDILVCVKQVPDTSEIKIDPVTNTLIRSGVPSIVNPFDANALEAAVQLKEAYGGTVTVISMGPEQAKNALKECISLGADKAVLISDRAFGGSDTLATSYILANAIKKLGKFDLVLCGKQAIDGDTGQVGPEIAEHLDMAQLTYVAKLAVEGDTITIQREHDEGYEVVEAKLPAVVTVVKSINNPRYPSIKSKMAANKAVINVLTAADLPEINPERIGLKGSPTKVKKTFTPPRKESGIRICEDTGSACAQTLLEKLVAAKLV
ncbi:electron transfer flavoprotein subunit beta/FixA family protein [Sporomusa acidovorans]|uniref:Electron transfer flavoprotein small subunit n=1 Tax=Sporomusa acidovorans (strain ATCC 49682 / DSM 3132 / Mol) TaxID=1123286 RepID=A0ABZ3IZZ8_SPOA4|nr:electron transfer flavoprotein subunit beta/FixA family protein [Sporomusa acidovorans]OZC21366.1 acryloyl-CoA reductase electron transfer subunit gamma [Sporomusa acidovorans DSM 3132]SDE56143.1 electron transfer flavoprotein beta subunit [Sporomusa acidovorans]